MDKALISRRFAKAVGTYLDKADVQRYVASRMAELTGRYIPSDIQERVLEIGCGTGMFTRMYLQQAAPEDTGAHGGGLSGGSIPERYLSLRRFLPYRGRTGRRHHPGG